MKRQLWYTDRITKHEQHKHKINKWFTRRKSKYQKILIGESVSFGRCLIIDDDLQSCELDEFIYHEALVHPALTLHRNPKSILILGGAEGATLREVLKHRTVQKVILVDIDSLAIELCNKYIPNMSAGAFQDNRVKIVIDDARKYILETSEKFDVIISDLSSPVKNGPAYYLYTQEFYKALQLKLADNGIFSSQLDSCNLLNIHVPAAILQTLKSVFVKAELYTCYIPSFDSLWGFTLASHHQHIFDVDKSEIEQRIKDRITGELKFYDSETHQGIFSLPKYLRKELNHKGYLITENNPVYIY